MYMKSNKSKSSSKRNSNSNSQNKCGCCKGTGELVDKPKNVFEEPLRTICPCCKGSGLKSKS